MDKNKNAYKELIKGIQNYTKECLDNGGYDRTYTALVKEIKPQGYSVLLGGQLYENVKTIGGDCVVNETVKVVIPQNNFGNMFILKGGTSSGGSGTGGGVNSVNNKVGDVILTSDDVGAIPNNQKGVANGIATLDENGFIPNSQLPSYVGDVLEYDTKSDFPTNGESGKIYVAIDTNLQYRWSGTQYVEISSSLALGETSSTAYYGDKGKIAYDHSQKTSGNPHKVTKSDIGLSNVPNVTTNNQTPTFTQASERTNIVSGETLSTIFGKITKWFSDFKAVAFSGSYNDLSNTPNFLTGGSQTTTSTTDGGSNVFTFTKANGDTSTFTVKNGNKGSDGKSAGFGTPTVSVDSNVGTPSVSITTSGDNTAKVFNFSFKNLKGSKGDKGNDGRGVSSSVVTYQASTSGTTIPTGTWSSSVPTVSKGQFLWTKTVFNYTSGNPTTTYSVSYIGTNGTNGQNGITPTIKVAQGENIGSVGTPTVTATTSGTTITFTFDYLKGQKGDSTSITVDSSLSTTSNNPIANKAVAIALNQKLDSSGTAVKAKADESGNNIKTDYASSITLSDKTVTLKSKSGVTLSTFTLPSITWK